jgi:hypothetical protein
MFLNFVGATALSSNVTFSRGSNATLVDSTGKITYAPANLFLQSQTFATSPWFTNNASITTDTTIAPDGTTTADKLVEDATNNIHRVAQVPTITANTHTATVYAKPAGRNWLYFANASLSRGAYFNVSTGVLGTVVGATTATITSVGNGWYRCSITSDANAGAQNYSCYAANADASFSYTGDGVSGLFIWGAQLEPVTYQTTPSTYVATTSAAYYGPRFDYDPVTLAPKGLLIEEQRTNLLTYSQGIGGTNWLPDDLTVTANSIAAPDGTLTASTLTDTATNSDHRMISSGTNPSFTVGASYTLSVYVKNNTRNFIQVVFGTGAFSATAYANFDVATGVLGTVGAGTTASITAVGSGWYRCTVTATATVTASTPIFFGLITSATAVRAELYAGTGSSLYVWGAQLEAGSFATSYIPTVASQVTRSADVATMTGTNFSSWYNQSEGTFVADFDKYSTALRGGVLCAGNISGASGTGITIDGQNNGKVRAFIENAGAIEMLNATLADYTANTPIKGAVAYATNNAVGAAAGALGTVDTSVVVPTVDNLQIGAIRNNSLAALLPLNGHIRQIAYYNTRLPNATLQALTA